MATTFGLLTAFSVGPVAAASRSASPSSCLGSVVGRVVLGYGDHGPAAGEWIQLTGMPGDSNGQQKLVRTAADGSFRVEGVPAGWHNGTARHAHFAVYVPPCGVGDAGLVPYPLVHPTVPPIPIGPTHPAAIALARFMSNRIARDEPAVRRMLTGALLPRAHVDDGVLFQVSNPCWYRYAVLSLVEWTSATSGQPPPRTVDGRVRLYAHFRSGDNGGGVPFSFVEAVRLIATPTGWKVSGLRRQEWQEEPGEPHGPTTSACVVARRAPVWLAARGELPLTGGIPAPALPAVGLLGLLLLASGFAARGAVRRGRGRG